MGHTEQRQRTKKALSCSSMVHYSDCAKFRSFPSQFRIQQEDVCQQSFIQQLHNQSISATLTNLIKSECCLCRASSFQLETSLPLLHLMVPHPLIEVPLKCSDFITLGKQNYQFVIALSSDSDAFHPIVDGAKSTVITL